MYTNLYTERIERAIYNWHMCGENANPGPIFSVVRVGAIHRVAEPELFKECCNLNSFPNGEVKVINAYQKNIGTV